MKMTNKAFNRLWSDFQTVLSKHFRCTISDDPKEAIIDAWAVFREVCAQRSYDDTHPRWKYNDRVLSPDWSDKWYGGQSGYLAYIYDNEGNPINDRHIATALKKILFMMDTWAFHYHETCLPHDKTWWDCGVEGVNEDALVRSLETLEWKQKNKKIVSQYQNA